MKHVHKIRKIVKTLSMTGSSLSSNIIILCTKHGKQEALLLGGIAICLSCFSEHGAAQAAFKVIREKERESNVIPFPVKVKDKNED